mmetsp:Transcript_7078/g.8053  ORF Transcript_7078/g.8053 Transcript_7078/m.8053 type:complete len:1125 (-) Transcript_7078:49-3423(-)
MYFQSGALTFLLASAGSIDYASAFGIASQHSFSSFITKPIQSYSARPTAYNSRTSLSMFGGGGGGAEELKELADEGDKLSKTVGGAPGLFKAGGLAAIPAAVALGAIITPPGVAVTVVGSAMSGVAGFIGKNRIDVATEAAAKPALAQLVIDLSVNSPEIEDKIKEIQTKFGVEDEEFVDICSDVYKKYLIGMVKTPITLTSEMKELSNLRKILNLNNLAVGEAHAAAAKEFYRQTCLFTPVEDLDDPEHPDRMSIDKFLFLSERVFRQGGETNEAFKYEMSRVAKAFDLKIGEVLERVAEVVEPFYQKALDTTRSKIDTDAVSSDMLLRARNSLGIDEMTANDMHLVTFADEVKCLLGKNDKTSEDADLSALAFVEGAKDRLSKLQDILELEDLEADYEISSEATPLFQARALAIMDEAIAGSLSPESAWEQLNTRQGELLLKDESMKDLLASMVMQAMGKSFEDTMAFAKVNNVGATYDKLLDALGVKEACRAVLQQSHWSEFDDFDGLFFDPASKSSAIGFLSRADRLRLYKIFLARSVRNSESGKELTDENYEKVKDVKGMLAITDADEADEFKMAFGQELQKTLNMAMFEMTGDDFTEDLVKNLEAQIDQVINDYRLSDSLVAEFSAPIYMRAVNIISDKTPSGIPSKEKMEQLDKLRYLLGMEKEDSYNAHLEIFGNAYKTSVSESMGSTGVITKEYRKPLDELKKRLGVSEEDSRRLYLDAMQDRMVPMIEYIVLELERTMLNAEQLARKRQKDFGEDYFKSGKGASGNLGLGAEANIMTDCMNLIDFYTVNDIAEKREIGTKTIEKKVVENDEEKTVTEEVPDYETVYPITGLGSNAVQQELAELLYRQFVVGGFTAQGPQAQRYEDARDNLGGILGLEKAKMEEVTNSIGSTIYENYINNSMRTKGQLDQQDMMFLANIQGKLNISSDDSEKMLIDTQKKLLSEEANAIVANESGPEIVKAFREKCNSMGLELEADVGLSRAMVEEMFEIEVSPALVNGDITIESGDLLTEIQESFGMIPEDAEKMFLDIILRRAKSAMSRIKAELLRGREENCVDIVLRLMRYGQFVNGELELSVDEATGWKIFNMYDSMDFEDMDKETVESNKSVLKISLGLS